MIVCTDKLYSACKLLLLGRGSSALFLPMVTNTEFRALVLKVVQDPEAAAAETNSQPVVLLRKGHWATQSWTPGGGKETSEKWNQGCIHLGRTNGNTLKSPVNGTEGKDNFFVLSSPKRRQNSVRLSLLLDFPLFVHLRYKVMTFYYLHMSTLSLIPGKQTRFFIQIRDKLFVLNQVVGFYFG